MYPELTIMPGFLWIAIEINEVKTYCFDTDRPAAKATNDTAAALACDECRCEMHRGRQSNGRLPPVLVVWVVHFAKKIDQPPTLGQALG